MINLWLALKKESAELINSALTTSPEPYTGSVVEGTLSFIRTMPDLYKVQSLFKSPTIDGNTYYVYSLYLNDDAQAMSSRISALSDEYTDHVIVLGAWNLDGSQVVGHPPHLQLIDFMPDTFIGDISDPSSWAYQETSEITDIVRISSQSPRDFS